MEEEFEMSDGGQAWENITFIYVGEHKSVGVKWENKNPGSGKKRERGSERNPNRYGGPKWPIGSKSHPCLCLLALTTKSRSVAKTGGDRIIRQREGGGGIEWNGSVTPSAQSMAK